MRSSTTEPPPDKVPSPSVRAEMWRNLTGSKARAREKADDDDSIGAETVFSNVESVSTLGTLADGVSEPAENDESMFSLDEDWVPRNKKC